MKFVAIIPARYAATRFPGKLMQLLNHQPIIVHTYLNTVATGLFSDVIVATDNEKIANAITAVHGKVFMSRKEHISGSDRIAEAAQDIDADVIINVQGDEPIVKKEPLQKLCDLFKNEETKVGSLMHLITDEQTIADPNVVKVVVNLQNEALYFSRSVIPFKRDESIAVNYYKHIGVYAYRKQTLSDITSFQPTILEQAEKLEQLRMLENGIKIKMAITDPWSISIDTPADLDKAKRILES